MKNITGIFVHKKQYTKAEICKKDLLFEIIDVLGCRRNKCKNHSTQLHSAGRKSYVPRPRLRLGDGRYGG